MNHRDAQIIAKLRGEAELLSSFVSGVSEDEFISDERTARAACMTLINIGELVKNLSEELKTAHREIPWRAIAGMRDVAAHKYQTLRQSDVYVTCIEDIPALLQALGKLTE